MKLIESKAEYIPQEEGLEGIYKAIEIAGRTAYNSQDKITPDSAKDFVDRMIRSKHGACLEHGTVYLKVPIETWREEEHEWTYIFPEELPWVSLDCDGKYWYITTNFRHVLEGNVGIETMNKYLCSPTEFHEKRYTMRFTCSRAIAQELTRHRVFSFLMSSQRYINYSKKRHGGEITYIIPSWFEQRAVFLKESLPNDVVLGAKVSSKINSYNDREMVALKALALSERNYMYLLSSEMTPQQARDVLPNATKTELIMTGFSSDWKHVLDLRLFEKTGKVHPDMKDLMQKAQKAMQEAGIWDDIMSKPSKFD